VTVRNRSAELASWSASQQLLWLTTKFHIYSLSSAELIRLIWWCLERKQKTNRSHSTQTVPILLLAFLLLASNFSQAGQGSSTIPTPPAARDLAEGFRRDFDAGFFGGVAREVVLVSVGAGFVGVEVEAAGVDSRWGETCATSMTGLTAASGGATGSLTSDRGLDPVVSAIVGVWWRGRVCMQEVWRDWQLLILSLALLDLWVPW